MSTALSIIVTIGAISGVCCLALLVAILVSPGRPQRNRISWSLRRDLAKVNADAKLRAEAKVDAAEAKFRADVAHLDDEMRSGSAQIRTLAAQIAKTNAAARLSAAARKADQR